MNQRDRNKSFTLVDSTYTYDANGNRTKKQTLAGLTTYQYDAANRLVKAAYPTGSEEYRYDKAGNRTEKLVNGISTERYQYDSRNRLISQDIISLRADVAKVSEHKEYTYDQQGNMLSDGVKNFTYDAMNRLSQVTNAEGHIQKNRYDGEGLRAEMEENGRLVSFLFDGDKVVAEKECDGNVIRYIRGYELISSDSEKAKTYYHYTSDEMGSITHVTDEAGNVCNHYEYDAFGEFTVREESISNRFGYAGEQYDAIAGLYYLRARFYNPVIGRFIQEDTYYGDGLNLYSYCQNNPVGYVDPSGYNSICPEKEAVTNKLMDLGFTKEQAESCYENFRNREVSGFSNEAEKILGPYYDALLEKHKQNPDYFAHPDGYRIVEGDEYVRNRAEYTRMVNKGELEPGHHILGIADGGQNIQTNITYTGEKFVTRDILPQFALDYYDSIYGKPSNPHPKRIAVYEKDGIVYFGKNPLHTQATTLQQAINKWQKDKGYRRK